ncbi:response regulator [Methanogenium cariaci]
MKHVLLVEDDPVLLKATELTLEKMGGFEVTGVVNAELAIDEIMKRDYSAIVSDYDMPGMDGLEFLKTVRDSDNDTPFIIFTGKGREEIAIKAYEQGADHYLQKGGDTKSLFYEIIQKINTSVEKKQIKRELEISRKLYANIFNHLPDPTFVIDNNGQVIGWNTAIEALTGVRREDIAGKGNYAYSEAIYGEKRPILIDLVLDPTLCIEDDYRIIRCDDGYFTAEKKVALSNGRKYDIWVKVSPMLGENNEFSGAIASLRDITSKKKAEDKIRRANDYNRSLIEAHIDPLVTIDGNGTITDINEAMEKLTGYHHDSLAGMYFFDLFTDPGKARGVHKRVMEGTRLMDVPLQVRTATGKESGILFFGSPYINGDGEVLGVFAELHDVLSLPGAEREMLCHGKVLQKCVSDGW